VADQSGNKIRKVSPLGEVTTVADGKGGPMRASGVAVDGAGNLYATSEALYKGVPIYGSIAPAITAQPVAQTVSIGGNFIVSVAATGTGLFTYQWFKDGTAVSGATASSCLIANVLPTDAGSYTGVVTNTAGSKTSDPAVLTIAHSADVNCDLRFGLVELTRVIELYNTRNGSTRTGRYKVQAGTEDGFAQDTTATANQTLTQYHSADSNRDGQIGLSELTRVIDLYNTRAGTSRTGQYHVQAGTEDGFAPGSNP
jgi:hypothetical protein